MKYTAPARDAVDPQVFRRMPLAGWREHSGLIEGRDWPSNEALNACRPDGMRERFVVQTRELLADGLHYEQRIAECLNIRRGRRHGNRRQCRTLRIWYR